MKDENACFVIDHSILREMIEGDNSQKSLDCLNLMGQIKAKTNKGKAITTMACLLNAIYTANKIDKERLQDILNVVEIVVCLPTNDIIVLNFKDDKAVLTNVIQLANTISR